MPHKTDPFYALLLTEEELDGLANMVSQYQVFLDEDRDIATECRDGETAVKLKFTVMYNREIADRIAAKIDKLCEAD